MKITQKLIMAVAASLLTASLSAQNAKASAKTSAQASSSEDEIELPEVTTVVSGDALTAGKESVPDYSKVLPSPETAAVPVPVLPDVKSPAQNEKTSVSSSSGENKSVYAEGKAGGGYPGYFIGDFSVYRERGDKPFRISFFHESADGFASKSAADGYFTRTTAVSAKQSFIGKTARADFSASYDTANDGLQSRSPSFYDTTRHTFACSGNAEWNLPHGFALTAGADGNWYNRYGGVPESAIDASAAENGATIVDISPKLSAQWNGNGFEIAVSGAYAMQSNFGNDDALSASSGSDSAQSTHRGEFGFDAGWRGEDVHVFGHAGIVCGTAIGNPIIVAPWTLGGDCTFVAPASAHPVSLSAEGGISTEQEKYSALETKYTYSVLQCIPSETTDWYALVKTSVPVKEIFSVIGSAEFRKSAFGNGVWEPLYDESAAASGLYFYEQKERTAFNTTAGMTAAIGIVTLGASWNSYWMHVPASCDPQNLLFSATIQPAEAQWTAGASFRLALGSDADSVPDISGSASVRLSPAISLAVELDDVVKLVTNTTRSFAATDYETKSGHGVLLVKFWF